MQRQLQAPALFRRLPRRREGCRRDGFRRLFESRREDDRGAADSLHRTHPCETAFDAADLRADDLPRERQFRSPFPQNRRGQACDGPQADGRGGETLQERLFHRQGRSLRTDHVTSADGTHPFGLWHRRTCNPSCESLKKHGIR